MNNIHKVIFNKTTQQFVVVSELAKSAAKPKAVSASSEDIISILQNFSEKRPLGTTNSQTNRSDNKSSSWSVGAFIGKSQESSGLGVEGAVNVGKGYANSDSKVQNLTEINSDSLSIKTKETTTLKGAVANINHLALETQNLHIESVQDTEKYDSKQSQVSGSGSLALGANGLNGGVSAQFSQNKAKVDYAQVNQQSGFNIQKSSNINVTENTHLKGGIINAEGDKANHQMTTGTLTMEAIENHSDVKVSSVSVGVSSDMSKMATMAVGAALSALGNMRESERSQTKAAISSNINLSITDSDKQKALTGKTAEETLQSLNRDTANANQAVEKADLNAIQEKQETAQVIGELSISWTNRLVQPHLDEANKKRQEAEKLEKSDPLKSAQLKAEAKAIEAEYGLGSNLQMGVRAATAALQGLATGNANQAAVGLLSPYANKLIKEQTTNADGTVNTEANLMAHVVLGAIEAYATGNNAAAGALGALTAEAAAPYLMQALYNTDKAENLTDSQKQNIANLSQIAAGLAGGVTGDSTADFVSGAEIGKRAVENNTFGDVHPSVDKEQTIASIAKAMFNGDEEKAEAYYEGTKQGEVNAQIDGVTGVVETVEATVDAIKNLDQTIAGIQDVIANPEKAFDKIAMSVEEWNKQLTLALETDPKLAGEMMGYLQGQGKFVPNAATSTVVLTGPIAVKLANLVKGGKASPQPNYKSDVGNLGVNAPEYNKNLNEKISTRVNGSIYNTDAVNRLKAGQLPGEGLDKKTGLPVEGKIGVPRNMPSSKDPDAMAVNFAEQFLGRKITPEEWDAGIDILKKNGVGKDCINCFRINLENGGVIMYRSGISNNSSDRTLAGTASLDINMPEINKYNKDTMLKLKFPKE